MTTESMQGPQADLPGPLDGIRVLELADEKGQFCGKLMADLGADVIKIEPPGGQNSRLIGPFLADKPSRETSLSFWHYNTSKRGVTLDLNSKEGQRLYRELARTADVVLETQPPGRMPDLGLGYDDLSKLNPSLIMCSLTPFGQNGPWRDFLSCDLLHLAAGGQMASSGYDQEDVPDAPPIAPGGGNAWHIAGHYAYIGILAALYHRDMTGEGQYIDASIHEACALTTEGAIAIYLSTGEVVQRHTGRHASPDMSTRIQLATKGGDWVNVTRSGSNLTPARLKVLAEWMDDHGMAQDLLDEKYYAPDGILENAFHITDVMAQFFEQMTQSEIWQGGQERDFPWGGVRTLDDIIGDPHLEEREFFVEVEHPELGQSFTYPGAAAIYNGSPWKISRRAPLVGEHNQEILCGELGVSLEELNLLAESGVV